VCAAATPHDDQRVALQGIQCRLFDLGGYLASPPEERGGRPAVGGPGVADVEELEHSIDRLETELDPLKRFILPGGTPASAALHFARTVCRRAERRTLALHRSEPLDAGSLRYLNRLSDLLFVMARVENRRAGEPDVEWESGNR
jgi:cob(I)alamin adenosyltransferase